MHSGTFMKPAPAPEPSPSCKPVRRGFGSVPCPRCGSDDYILSLDLADLNTFTCDGCKEEFLADDVRNLIAAWQPVLAWIDLAPQLPE